MNLNDILKSTFDMTLEEVREEGLRNLYLFAKGICGFSKLSAETHLPGCLFLSDETIRDKGIIWPRGCAKSSCVKARLLQHIAKNPNVRILYVSKTVKAASGKLQDMETRIQGAGHSLIPVIYPEMVPKEFHNIRWSATAFEVPNRTASWDEATVEAAGIGTNKTGQHYDIIFLDDPVAPDKDDLTDTDIIISEDEMKKAIGYIELIDGLLDPSGMRIIYYAGTRWAVEDCVSWLKKRRLSMKFNEVNVLDEEGKPNFPTFIPVEQVEELRINHGSMFFQSQYFNNPEDADRKPFKIRDIEYYKKAPSRDGLFVTVTVDPSMGIRGSISKTAILAAGSSMDGKIYVLDYLYGAFGPQDTVSKTMVMCKRYDPNVLGFEAVGYQASLEAYFREAQRSETKRWLIHPVKRSRTSKDARILALQPFIENHDVFVREGMLELLRELDAFPYGAKDLLDTLADHVEIAKKRISRLDSISRIAPWIAEPVQPPLESERLAAVYQEGTVGYILGGFSLDGVLYITSAVNLTQELGFQDPLDVINSLKPEKCFMTREMQKAFFYDAVLPIVVTFSQPKVEGGKARLSRGMVKVPKESDAALTFNFSIGDEILLKAVDFFYLAAQRRKTCTVALVGAPSPSRDPVLETANARGR